MIDTVRISIIVSLSPEQLTPWVLHRTERNRKYREKWFYSVNIENGCVLKFTYHPRDYTGNPRLIVDTSLPKLLYGENYLMLNNVGPAIDKLNRILHEDPSLPNVDVGAGSLCRLDICFNYQVGSNVLMYLTGIRNLHYPRRTRDIYYNCSPNGNNHEDNGVKFRAKTVSTTFYDKHLQCGNPLAEGLLRHEVSYKNSKSVEQALGTKKPTLRDVTREAMISLLRKDLHKLNLHNAVLADEVTCLKMLKEKFSTNKAYRLYEALIFFRDNEKASKKELAKLREVTVQTINMWLREIKAAGITPTVVETTKPLAPLDGLLSDQFEDKFSKLQSNTIEITTEGG